MSRCTHNDSCPELQPCKNEGVGKDGYCVEHGCCLCGGVMFADTEDWKVYLCFDCYIDLKCAAKISMERVGRVIDAAYEAGRKSVIGHPLEPDDVVEKSR